VTPKTAMQCKFNQNEKEVVMGRTVDTNGIVRVLAPLKSQRRHKHCGTINITTKKE